MVWLHGYGDPGHGVFCIPFHLIILHILPSKQKKQYRDFILSLQHVLPCGHCRKNLTKNLKRHPLTMRDMKNRETFSRWLYDFHEVVNIRCLHKKSNLTYEQVRDRYEHFRSRCTQNSA